MRAVQLIAEDDAQYMWEATYYLDDDGTLPVGGIILSDVRHGGYNLASEIRVMGFWIEYEIFKDSNSLEKKYKHLPLDKGTFNLSKTSVVHETRDAIVKKGAELYKKYGSVYDRKALFTEKQRQDFIHIMDDLQQFSKYNFVAGIQATYSLLEEDLGFENCEYGGLDITQTYLFTDYKSEPAHEPTGGLTATRLFPLIKTAFKTRVLDGNADNKTLINSIRVDYRFRPKLDAFLYFKEGNNPAEAKRIMSQKLKGLSDTDKKAFLGSDAYKILIEKPQQAGVFADEESVDLKGGVLGAEQAVFKAVEKPLVYEIAAGGLERGLPFWKEAEDDIKGWDNIHWWGGYKDYHIPSAPGAFHALHLHWRWGASVKKSRLGIPRYGNESQFINSGIPSELSKDPRYKGFLGPLVDPKIWSQTIRFVVLQKQNIIKDTEEGFFNTFILKENKSEKKPKEIKEGEPLELWYSIELHKKLILTQDYILPEKEFTSKLSGTIFIQGLFFAHEKEEESMFTGSTTKEYFPVEESQVKKNFIRHANL